METIVLNLSVMYYFDRKVRCVAFQDFTDENWWTWQGPVLSLVEPPLFMVKKQIDIFGGIHTAVAEIDNYETILGNWNWSQYLSVFVGAEHGQQCQMPSSGQQIGLHSTYPCPWHIWCNL